MFTGIIQDIGEILAIDRRGDWVVTVATHLPLDHTKTGASIAHSGICLTAIEISPQGGRGHYKVQLSEETLSKTTALRWQVGTRVNLETALRAGDELGGHYVSGHIDGIARVESMAKSADSLRLQFDVPADLAKYIASKGSATIDGVSLTVNHVDGSRFGVNVIPHTQKATTLGTLKIGDEANIEVDMIARYVERILLSCDNIHVRSQP
jgi:riboflavin synthase